MKNLLTFVLITISCANCIEDHKAPNDPTFDKTKKIEDDFMAKAQNLGFKYDYNVKVKTGLGLLNPNSDEFRALKLSNDKRNMEQNYPSIKSNLKKWTLSADKQRSEVVQKIALRYLRNYFLNKSNQTSLDETSFLFELLINHKSVDLDILADAYVALLPRFTQSEKKQYFDYIQSLHDKEIKYITQKSTEYKNSYENAEGNSKGKFLLYGKDLERRSQACRYVREIMGIELK